jgi:hypothetical protein
MKYIEHEKFPGLAKLVKECLPEDLTTLLAYSYDVAADEPLPDYTGRMIKGREDVKLYYVPIENYPAFQPVVTYISNMTGIDRAILVLVGPKSVVPLHVDNAEYPAYMEFNVYNMLVGISGTENIRFQVDGISKDPKIGEAIIFDAQHPHEAWNDTDCWWISIIVYVDKKHVK